VYYFSQKINDSQSSAFAQHEFKNFESKYTNVDLFIIDEVEIDLVCNLVENKQVVIYYADMPPENGLDVFFKIFNGHPEKTFYILTEFPGWADLAQWPSNTHWIFYTFLGVDIASKYKNANYLPDKNFDSEKISISLNRMPRTHRLCSLSYMLGIGLDQDCVITAPLLPWYLSQSSNNLDILNVVSWEFSEHDSFKKQMLKGWTRAKRGDGIFPVTVDAYAPYDQLAPIDTTLDNLYNYENNLVPLYQNSFVEFVNFTIYDYELPCICEKLLNSQLGGNFPIFVAGKNTVKWLSQQGFDVFDDIVNHSYDREDDPVLRMQKLIEDNRILLTNRDITKNLWIKNSYRFKNNFNWWNETSDKVLKASRETLNNLLITEHQC